MKSVKASAPIVRLSPVVQADGTPLFRNGRKIVARAILGTSTTFEAAIKLAAELHRDPSLPNGDKTASFCLKRDDGMYAIDLNEQQLAILTGGRFSLKALQVFAHKCQMNVVVQLRNIGDIVFDRRTQEERTINQAHAAIQDLSLTLPFQLEEKIENIALQAEFGGYGTVTPITTPTRQGVTSAEIAAAVEANATPEDDENAMSTQVAPKTTGTQGATEKGISTSQVKTEETEGLAGEPQQGKRTK